MSLAGGPQQQPIIRKSTAGTILAQKPQILKNAAKAKTCATLVSRAVTDRIIAGPAKPNSQNPVRPVSLRKPIVKPPKDSVAQLTKNIQNAANAHRSNLPTSATKNNTTQQPPPPPAIPPRPPKPVVSIVSARKSLMGTTATTPIDMRRPSGGAGGGGGGDSAFPRTSSVAAIVVNKGASSQKPAHSGADPAARRSIASDAQASSLQRSSLLNKGPASAKPKVVIAMRTPRTSLTEPTAASRDSVGKSVLTDSQSRPSISARGGRGATVCVPPRGRAQIVSANRDRNTPAIVRRGIGVRCGAQIVGSRGGVNNALPRQQPQMSSGSIPPMFSRSGVPLMGRPQRRRIPGNADPYGLDEMTAEDLDFIDDGGEDNDTSEWLHELRGVTGYDPSKFRGVDEARESNHSMMAYEERLSAQIARREDLEEFKKAAQESSDSDDED